MYSWIYCNDALLKSYRESNLKEPSKSNLSLNLTIHCVKTIAYSVMSAFGMVVYMASLGHIQNRPWQYARLHGEMMLASANAIFIFKPVMEKLRVAEAKSFFSAFLGHQGNLSLVSVIKAPKRIDLLPKLEGLSEVQLEEVFKDVTRGIVALESAFLAKLHGLRQETAEPAKAAIVDKQIQRLQSNLHSGSGLIACRYIALDGVRIALTAGKLALISSMPRNLVRPQDHERVARAWQQCPDQNVRLAAMPAL